MFNINNYYFNPQALPIFSVAAMMFCAGIFVYSRNKALDINKSFLLICLSVDIWLIATAFGYISNIPSIAKTWFKVDNFGVIFISINVYLFVTSFLGLKRKLLILTGYITAFGLGITALTTDLLVKGVRRFFWGYFPQWGYFSIFVLLFFFGFMLASFIELWRYYRITPSPVKKNHIKYIFVAFLGAYTAFVDYLPTFGIEIYPSGYISIAFFLSVIAYSILKYRLMDIEVVIKKTLVFAGIFTAAYAVIVGITFLGQVIFEELTGANKWLLLIPSVAVIILMLRPLESFLIRVTDRSLFQKKYDYKQLISQFMDELKTMVLNAQDIAQSTLDFLNSSIRPDASVIFMHNKFTNRYDIIASVDFHDASFKIPDNASFIEKLQDTGEIIDLKHNKSFSDLELKELEAMRIHLVIPLIIHKELLGILGLGKKKSDEEYTEEDIEALSNLSGTLSIALNNAQLFDERADAEKRAMIGTLATGINHEIGNPLNVIAIKLQSFRLLSERGLLQKKSKEEIIDEVNAITKICLENTRRISDITKKVSEFAKPDKKLALDKVNVAEAIDETLSILQHELVLERIRFEKNINCESPYVKADRGQIKQILFNLIKNGAQAIEAANKKDGKIIISVDRHGDNEISLKISDNGLGIPKTQLDKIFMPFYTTKEPGKGTGLGLALVNRLVERNDGRIDAKSQEGKGTTFTIIFKGYSYG